MTIHLDSIYEDLVTDPCPAGGPDHEPKPAGYVARSYWASQKLVTHDCDRCKHCGLFAVWEERPPTRWWCDRCEQTWAGSPVCDGCDDEPIPTVAMA